MTIQISFDADLPISKSRVDKAGRTLRRAAENVIFGSGETTAAVVVTGEESEVDSDAIFNAAFDLSRFRQAHSPALAAAVDTLRVVRDDLDPESPQPAARLKREREIVGKLCRLEQMKLSRMDDIAGCRLVVAGLAELRSAQKVLMEKLPQVEIRNDYVERPKEIGYRAVHLVSHLPADEHILGPDTLVRLEIQIRTKRQQDWADGVERIGDRTGFDTKRGDKAGIPEDLFEYIQLAATVRSLADSGAAPDNELEARLVELRRLVIRHF